MASCLSTERLIADSLCIPVNPIEAAGKFYGIGLSIIGGLALIFLLYGGYVIMMSQGNPQELNKGKTYIYSAITSLLLAVFGFVFVEIVFVDILQIPGFSR